MKKTTVLCIICACCLLAGCGKTTAQDEPEVLEEAPEAAEIPAETFETSPEEDEALEDWQRTLIDYMENESKQDYNAGYVLIYLDGDEIPEIAEIGCCEACGNRIVNYSGGEAHVTQLYRLYFTYIPGENLLFNPEGNMGHYVDSVYSIIDGKMTLLVSGTRDEEEPRRLDENGGIIMHYKWNGTELSEEEYKAELAKVYDESKAAEGYEYGLKGPKVYSAEELVELLRAVDKNVLG